MDEYCCAILFWRKVGKVMTKEDLINQLKQRLSDVADKIDGFEESLINTAISHLDQLRPSIKKTTLTLSASEGSYDAPDDTIEVNRLIWQENATTQPWESNHIDAWPECFMLEGKVTLSPKPSVAQISVAGSDAVLYYHAKRQAEDLSDYEADLVLLRAMAEAMRLESIRKSNKPVQLRDGHSPNPKNATPSSLYEAFLQEFKEGCRG